MVADGPADLKKSKFDGLQKAIESSYRGLDPSRKLFRALVEQYAGPAYGESSDKRKKYLNKINQAVDAYMIMVAANRPQCQVDTVFESLRPFANQYEHSVNNLIKEIGFEHTLRRWVMDAFFLIGFVKVHQKNSVTVEFEPDLKMDPGSPFASNVPLDNFVYDVGANVWGELKWAGDSYRLPIADIREGAKTGVYDPDVASTIKATSKFAQSSEERVDQFSLGTLTDDDEYEPMADLCDVWVKRDQKIYTFAITDRDSFKINPKPLAEIDWPDHNCSPYFRLAFIDVPGNIMSVSPASLFDELERLINSLLRKQARQAQRQKEFTTYSASSAESAKRMERTSDGGMIQVNDPTDIGSVSQGGVHPANQAFLRELLEFFNDQSGNITSMMGLGAQADTVGQEQLIHASSNRKIGQMQSRVLDGIRGVIRSLGLHLWIDDFKEIAYQFDVPGTIDRYPVEGTWKPGDREGKFELYNLDVNADSILYRPPAAQAETLNMLLSQIYIPLLGALTEQGGTIDFAELADAHADLLNMPRLKQIVRFSTVPGDEEATPSSHLRQKPAQTTRVNVRKNVSSGQPDQSQNDVAAQAWMNSANGHLSPASTENGAA